MNAAALVREARKRAGLTQQEVSTRSGTSQPAVARYEAGLVEPSPQTLLRLLRACGLDLEVRLVEPQPEEGQALQANLRLSPNERLDQLEAAVRFIAEGRAAMGRV